MSDDPEQRSEVEEFSAEIRRALAAYTEFQRHFSDATERWQQHFSQVGLAVEAIGEKMVPYAIAIAEAQAKAAGYAEAMMKQLAPIANLTVNWHESQAAIGKRLQDGISRLHQNLQKTDRLGRLGWTMTGNMTIPDLLELVEFREQAEADAYMVSWYESSDPDLVKLENRVLKSQQLESFGVVVSQCFSAFRRGDFAVAIPPLMATLERAIRHLGPAEHFTSTAIEKTVRNEYSKIMRADQNKFEVYFWLSLYEFVRRLYEQYLPSAANGDQVSRHGIQHGMQAPPNDKVEALRLFNALDTVISLY